MFKAGNIVYYAIALFALSLLLFNIKVPLLPGDDYIYFLMFPQEGYPGSERISTISHFVNSTVNHYYNYNNRIVPHALLQTVLLLPSYVFDISNSFVFLLLPLLLLKAFPNIRGHERVKTFAFMLGLAWLFHPDLGRAYFWTSGSINYSWFLIPQIYYSVRLLIKFDRKELFGFKDVLIALLICTSNEHVVLCLFVMSCFVFIRELILRRKADLLLGLSMVSLLFGGIVMLNSPALLERFHDAGQIGAWYNFDARENLFRIALYCTYILGNGTILFLFGNFLKPGKRAYFILVMMIISLGIMLFTPLFEPRAAVFPYYLSFLLYLSCVKPGRTKTWPLVIVFLFVASTIPDRWQAAKILGDNIGLMKSKLTESRTSKDTIYLEKMCIAGFNKAIPCEDIFLNPEHLHNKSLAAYFDFNFVGRIEESACWRMEGLKDSLLFTRGAFIESGIDKLIYKYDSESLCLAFVLNTLPSQGDTTVIIRGARKTLSHYLTRVLPYNYRLYFLDYLEEDMSQKNLDGLDCYVRKMEQANTYDYYLISAYSLSQHMAIGPTIYFDNPSQ